MERLKKRMAKSDVLLIGLLVLAAAAGMRFAAARMKTEGAAVRITVDGAVYGTYDLSTDQVVPIESGGTVTNTLQISGGRAEMTAADCPDKLCMHQKAVEKQGETIVCLPNKIVVEVQGDAEAEVDVVSQ